MNTMFSLMYRDINNYKSYAEVIVVGEITVKQITDIKATLEEGYMFIAPEVGFPSPADYYANFLSFPNDDDDHAYTTLTDFQEGEPVPTDMLTDEPVNSELTLEQIVKSFIEMPGDFETEMSRLFEFKTWSVERIENIAEANYLPMEEGDADTLLTELGDSYRDDTLTTEIVIEAIKERQKSEVSPR